MLNSAALSSQWGRRNHSWTFWTFPTTTICLAFLFSNFIRPISSLPWKSFNNNWITFLYSLNTEWFFFIYSFFGLLFSWHGTGRFTGRTDKNQQREVLGFCPESNNKSWCSVFPYSFINWIYTSSEACCSARVICRSSLPTSGAAIPWERSVHKGWTQLCLKNYVTAQISQRLPGFEEGRLGGPRICFDGPRFVTSWQIELFTSEAAFRGHGTIKINGLHFSTRCLSSA